MSRTHGTLIPPWVSDQIATILEAQLIRDRILYYREDGIRVLNEHGDLEDSVNDVGALLFA